MRLPLNPTASFVVVDARSAPVPCGSLHLHTTHSFIHLLTSSFSNPISIPPSPPRYHLTARGRQVDRHIPLCKSRTPLRSSLPHYRVSAPQSDMPNPPTNPPPASGALPNTYPYNRLGAGGNGSSASPTATAARPVSTGPKSPEQRASQPASAGAASQAGRPGEHERALSHVR